jgi:hypothetical protein
MIPTVSGYFGVFAAMKSGKHTPALGKDTVSTAEFDDCNAASPRHKLYMTSAVSAHMAICQPWSVLLRENKKDATDG